MERTQPIDGQSICTTANRTDSGSPSSLLEQEKNEHTPFQAENPRTNGWPSFIPMGPITPEFREHLLFLFLLCIQLGLRLLEAFFDIFFLTFQFLGVFP